MAEREAEVIDDLKARVRDLSDADVNLLADPQRPCTLRDHRVADELITALAREVRRLRHGGGRYAPGAHVIDEAARTVSVVGHNDRMAAWYTFNHLEDAGRVADMRKAARAFPDGLAAAWLRAREELVRRGLIAGEVAGE